MKETSDYIYFWGSFLSNFFETEIIYKGLKAYSSEQIFMAEKALCFNDQESYQKILQEKDPAKCKKLGKKVKGFKEDKWNEVKFQIMVMALTLKFSQNLELKKKLLATGNKTLVEGSPYDRVWGVGLKWDDPLILNSNNWKGENLLGKALMQVRESLK